jgi:hypothetical protein
VSTGRHYFWRSMLACLLVLVRASCQLASLRPSLTASNERPVDDNLSRACVVCSWLGFHSLTDVSGLALPTSTSVQILKAHFSTKEPRLINYSSARILGCSHRLQDSFKVSPSYHVPKRRHKQRIYSYSWPSCRYRRCHCDDLRSTCAVNLTGQGHTE